MIESYIKKVELAKDVFLNNLKSLEATLKTEISNQKEQVSNFTVETNNYKARERELDKKYNDKFRLLSDKQLELDVEINKTIVSKNKYDSLLKELELNKKEQNDYLDSIKNDKKKIEAVLKSADEKLSIYNEKLKNLTVEFDRLDGKSKELKHKEQIERTRKEENDKESDTLNSNRGALKELALDLAIKEKRIKIELKKLQLKD